VLKLILTTELDNSSWDPNQDNNVLETLKNIEQGIASLGVNYGQGNNMNQSSNYGDFSNFGIGSFFPPYGGMYG
jgi:hypothetical protein